MRSQALSHVARGVLALATAPLASCTDDGGTTPGVTITAPAIVSPNAASPIADNPPVLTVTNASVSDGSVPTYTFQVATDRTFGNIVRQAVSVLEGSAQTSWTPDAPFADGDYFWRSQAVSGSTVGQFSTIGQFVAASEAPTGQGESPVVFDSLTDGTTLGERFGGAFTGQGWRVNTNGDFIRYEVPAVTNGYVQWQNVGLTADGANDASHMLMGMWDPSAGDFRQNPFRVHVQKLWRNPHNPPFMRLRWISQGREHDAGVNFTGWSPGQVYTFRVDWGPASGANTARLFLDDVVMMSIDYNRPYAPGTHFIELGIGERGESVIDAVYRNFSVVRRDDLGAAATNN